METVKDRINRLLGIKESYKAPETMMALLQDRDTAKKLFVGFLEEFGHDLSFDCFRQYFEEEHADRKGSKQDFTPECVSRIMIRIAGEAPRHGVIHEPAAGTGSTVIAHWYRETRAHLVPWNYHPGDYLYLCEEISDRAVPFLLFNIMIRGMNAVVIHGDVLTRDAREIYHCENRKDCYISFSELRKLPHTEEVEKFFRVKFI